MKTRLLLIGIAVVLLILNLVKWFGMDHASLADTAAEQLNPTAGFTEKDFRFPVRPSEEELVASRNLYSVASQADMETSGKNSQREKPDVHIEQARRMLNSVHLVGILSQGGRKKAFVKLADESFVVFNGGRVGGRLVVKEIGQDSIRLYDPETSLSKEVVLSGD